IGREHLAGGKEDDAAAIAEGAGRQLGETEAVLLRASDRVEVLHGRHDSELVGQTNVLVDGAVLLDEVAERTVFTLRDHAEGRGPIRAGCDRGGGSEVEEEAGSCSAHAILGERTFDLPDRDRGQDSDDPDGHEEFCHGKPTLAGHAHRTLLRRSHDATLWPILKKGAENSEKLKEIGIHSLTVYYPRAAALSISASTPWSISSSSR